MNYTNLTKVALKALRRNKMRTFLTMLGIIIGVGSVIAMLAIGQGSKKSIQDQMSSMGSNVVFVMPGSQARGGVQMGNSDAQSLTEKDIDAIQAECPSITMVSPEARSSGQAVYGNKNSPTTIYGENSSYFAIRKINIESGRIFTESEVKSSAKVCLVGKTVVTNLMGEGANPIGQVIRFKKIPMRVIGVLAERGQSNFGQDQDDQIVAPITTVQKRILAINYFQTINASAISEEKSDQAVVEITSALRKSHKIKYGDEDDFQVRTQAEMVKMFSSISDVLTILLGAIAGISLLVGGIGIMNIMYVSVTERTREIGLRLAVGGKGVHILSQFLMESILISVIGGLLGILLGYGIAKLVALFMSWPAIILPQSVIMAFVVCTAIGVFFGWYPARKASNLDPIDALRYE
jgi:putative ABC transport system permease protein